MTETDPAFDTFVNQPREQFVDQPRAHAVGRGEAESLSRAARTSSAPGSATDGQRLAQSPLGPSQPGAAPTSTLVHRGRVGNTGTVSVTTGEAITGLDGRGVRQNLYGLIALEYSDLSPGGPARLLRTHWLQFVRAELLFGNQTRLAQAAGLTYVNGVPVPLMSNARTATWRVDTLPPPGVGSSRAIIPWYDYPAQSAIAPGGGPAIRTPTSLQIFDAPGPGESTDVLSFVESILSSPVNRARIGARQPVTDAMLAFHFDTYLVRGSAVLYHVVWSAAFIVAGLDRPSATRASPRRFVVHPSSGPVSRLPRAQHAALVREFPAYGRIAHQ